MSNTGKQQFTANQSIYQLSDKDRSVPDDIDFGRSVWTRLYTVLSENQVILPLALKETPGIRQQGQGRV